VTLLTTETRRRARWLAALDVAAGVLAIAASLAVALSYLNIEPWLDEFWTLALVRPGTSAGELLARLSHDAHPFLYFGLVWAGQGLGLEGAAQLRALNLLFLPLVALPAFGAARSGDLSWRAALLILVLATASRIFTGYLSELRPYGLTYGASLGFAILWAAQLRRVLAGEEVPLWMRLSWFGLLGILANLQYFGCLIGAILTGLMMAALAVRRDGARALRLGLGSLVVAAPAVALAYRQSQGSIAGDMAWITSTPGEAVWSVVRVLVFSGLGNLAVALAVLAAGFQLVRSREAWRSAAPALGLILGAGLFLALVLAINLVKPWVQDRYLIAAAGPLTVAAALLATGPAARRAAPILAAVVLVLASALSLWSVGKAYSDRRFDRDGWRPGAAAAQAAVRACATTRLYIAPAFLAQPVGAEYGQLFEAAKRYGYAYHLRRRGLTAVELAPGGAVTPVGACPAVIWLEHVRPPYLAAYVRSLRVPAGAAVTLRRLDWGEALIFVHPAAVPRTQTPLAYATSQP
jgi:hypothetical protein